MIREPAVASGDARIHEQPLRTGQRGDPARVGDPRGRLDARSSLLELQRVHGNRYVARMLARFGEHASADGGRHLAEVEHAIDRASTRGRPLDAAVQRRMETAFGTDLARVRVHDDAQADSLNRTLDARAFTTGHHIFFRAGAYSPGTSAGRQLLAHELTHVVQQSDGGVRAKLVVSDVNDHSETEAERVAETLGRLEHEPIVARMFEHTAGLGNARLPTDTVVHRQPQGFTQGVSAAVGGTGGALAGAGVGFLVAGPLGAAVGAGIGALAGGLLGGLAGWKTAKINTTVLAGASDTSAADFSKANSVWAQAKIAVSRGTSQTLTRPQTDAILGADGLLEEFTGDTITGEEAALIAYNRTPGRITTYWVPGLSDGSRGEAIDPSGFAVTSASIVVSSRDRAADTFAHELGHVLLECDHEADASNLMASGATRNFTDNLTNAQVAKARGSRYVS